MHAFSAVIRTLLKSKTPNAFFIERMPLLFIKKV